MKNLIYLIAFLTSTQALADLPKVYCQFFEGNVSKSADRLNIQIAVDLGKQSILKSEVKMSRPDLNDKTICVTVSKKGNSRD